MLVTVLSLLLLFGCFVPSFFFFFNDVNFYQLETQIYKYAVYVYEMLNERKKCLFFY